MFIAPFVPSPAPVVEYMLKLADLKAGEVLFDLGSGDGRTVIMAAKTSARVVSASSCEKTWQKARAISTRTRLTTALPSLTETCLTLT